MRLDWGEVGISRLIRVFQRLRSLLDLPRQVDELRFLTGQIGIELQRLRDAPLLPSHELRVFSQWGEDGLIQFLLRHVPIRKRVFIEFGVEDYSEANTRFLLQHDDWSGLVLDGSPENIARIQTSPHYWRHDLRAVCAWVEPANVNDLFRAAGVEGEIGLLSIDVDGSDYWIWEAVEVVQPQIVICEYNSLFGPSRAVTVPYSPRFQRARAHHSCLYYGASLTALERLGRRKGYALVGGNRAGNNAFFVREDSLGSLPRVAAEEAWVMSRFRESRDAAGLLTLLDFAGRRSELADQLVLDLETGQLVPVRELGPG